MKSHAVDIKAPLQKHDSFRGKINALLEYLYIGTIECRVKENITRPIQTAKPKYHVTNIFHSLATPSYITNYLNTSWKYLEQTLEKELAGDEGFYNTRKILLECRDQCRLEIDKYNFDDPYTFEAIHSITIVAAKGRFPALWNNL